MASWISFFPSSVAISSLVKSSPNFAWNFYSGIVILATLFNGWKEHSSKSSTWRISAKSANSLITQNSAQVSRGNSNIDE